MSKRPHPLHIGHLIESPVQITRSSARPAYRTNLRQCRIMRTGEDHERNMGPRLRRMPGTAVRHVPQAAGWSEMLAR